MLETGEMREGDQSTREQMETLVCMSLEEIESSVYTAGTVAAFHPHLDCGDVMCLILVERLRASTFLSTLMQDMVSYYCEQCANHSINNIFTGLLNKSVMCIKFTLHTEPRVSVPEFTISCLTHGGPATTVQWIVNGVYVQEDSDHETSQLILDTSLKSVYDSRLRVRGRRSGTYSCIIHNNIRMYLPMTSPVVVDNNMTITGRV